MTDSIWLTSDVNENGRRLLLAVKRYLSRKKVVVPEERKPRQDNLPINYNLHVRDDDQVR